MLSRRRQIDPETARLIEQRLEHLLLEPPERSDRVSTPQRAMTGPDRSVAGGRHPEQQDREEWDDWPDPDPDPDPAPAPALRRSRSADFLDDLEPEPAPPLRPGWRDRLGSVALSRSHLGVVAVLAVLALLAAGWVVLRARPVAVATPLPTGSSSAASYAPSGTAVPVATPTPTGSGTVSPGASQLVLHVLGAVRRPGLVRLPDKSRVADAIAAAGGLRRGADPDRLNLAAPVADGEQIFVGTADDPAGEVREGTGMTSGSGPSGSGSATGGSGSGAISGDPVDLNAATQAQLEELPGVGPVTAEKIMAWRTEHGRFSKVEELQEVSGIGPKTYAEIAPHCRV